jgi:multidrug efflux pump subunit AcrA (membrane-fusion protein)
MGAEGLGSSVGSLPGGAGGSSGGGGGGPGGRGGGGSEFMLVLQDGAKPGMLVKKGDPVAEFDRQYMLTRLDDYKAGVAQSEASFRKMEAELEVSKQAHNQTVEVAKADLDKAKLDMKTLPVLSAMDAERRRLTLEEAQARYSQISQEVKFVDAGIKADRRVAEIQLKQSQLELKRNENNVEKMVMKAPIDGLVVYQNVFRGSEFDQIKVGDQLFPGQMFMQIVDPSSMVINANVSQVDVEKLRIGMKARVRFDAFPDLELPARVYAVASVAKSGRYRPDWVKDLGVVLKLEKMDRRVIPDLSVSCDVILDSSDSAVVAPLEGVFHEGDAPKPGTPAYVFVRAASGAWQRRQVELGLASFTHVAIAKGLSANEVIALEKPPSKEAGPPNVS